MTARLYCLASVLITAVSADGGWFGGWGEDRGNDWGHWGHPSPSCSVFTTTYTTTAVCSPATVTTTATITSTTTIISVSTVVSCPSTIITSTQSSTTKSSSTVSSSKVTSPSQSSSTTSSSSVSSSPTPCANGTASCNGGPCQDILTDSNNCGKCGNKCPSGSSCVNGVCTSSACTGQTCETFTTCGPGGSCVCASITDGTGFCVDGNTPCAGLATCTSNPDCPAGSVCAVNTCCSTGVCITQDQCGGATSAKRWLLEERDWTNGTIAHVAGWV